MLYVNDVQQLRILYPQFLSLGYVQSRCMTTHLQRDPRDGEKEEKQQRDDDHGLPWSFTLECAAGRFAKAELLLLSRPIGFDRIDRCIARRRTRRRDRGTNARVVGTDVSVIVARHMLHARALGALVIPIVAGTSLRDHAGLLG